MGYSIIYCFPVLVVIVRHRDTQTQIRAWFQTWYGTRMRHQDAQIQIGPWIQSRQRGPVFYIPALYRPHKLQVWISFPNQCSARFSRTTKKGEPNIS